jgi:transposase, IS30 family
MRQYVRLTLPEREEISRSLVKEHSFRFIARKLGRSPGSLIRELDRNGSSVKSYRAASAHGRALTQRHSQRKPRKLDQNPALKEAVLGLLAERWSPEQIAKRLPTCYPCDLTMRISHESIYSYLYVLSRGELKRELISYLRWHRPNRRPRSKVRLKSCPIQDFISIEERPTEVQDRTVPGHWEGDLLVGRRNGSVMGTLVERTTRFTLLVPLSKRDSLSVRKAFSREFKSLPIELKQSLTYDHGQEMAGHKLFSRDTKMRVYFAHPRCPWERGSNENTNGLLRQFFPKGTDFRKISRQKIKAVQKMFNGRPRKVLNWRTPSEVFNELLH